MDKLIFDKDFSEKEDIAANDTVMLCDHNGIIHKGKVGNILKKTSDDVAKAIDGLSKCDTEITDITKRVIALENGGDIIGDKYPFQALISYENKEPLFVDNLCRMSQIKKNNIIVKSKSTSIILNPTDVNTRINGYINDVNDVIGIYSDNVNIFRLSYGTPLIDIKSLIMVYDKNLMILEIRYPAEIIDISNVKYIDTITIYNNPKLKYLIIPKTNGSIALNNVGIVDLDLSNCQFNALYLIGLPALKTIKWNHTLNTTNLVEINNTPITNDTLRSLSFVWKMPSNKKGELNVDKTIYAQMTDDLKKQFNDNGINIVVKD